MPVQPIGRYRQIIRVLAKYGLADLMEERGRRNLVPGDVQQPSLEAQAVEIRALNLRLALQELGPTFVKFGQVLSTRPDLLPPPYLSELEKLQDDVPPFAYEEARAIVETELGCPLTEVFTVFYTTPLASASLAQVHEAVLPNGDQVVVKIQRAEVYDIIRKDMPILRTMAELICSRFEWGRLYDIRGIVEELQRSLTAELDFELERLNLEVMARNLEEFPSIHVPRVYPELSTRRILVQERVFGQKPGNNHANPELAAECMHAFLKQFAIDGFFHADPHPGNVLVTRDDQLYLLDLGMVGYLDSRSRRGFTKVLLAMMAGQGGHTAELFSELGEPGMDFRFHDYRFDIGRLVAKFHNTQFNIGELLLEAVRIGNRYQLKVHSQLTLMFKALAQLDGIVRALAPGSDPLEMVKPYLLRVLGSQTQELFSPLSTLNMSLEASEAAVELPRRLNMLLDRLSADNRIRLQFEHINLDNAIAPMGMWINRLVVALVFLGLTLSSSIIIASHTGPTWFGYSVLGLLGFLVAIGIGTHLLYTVIRTKTR